MTLVVEIRKVMPMLCVGILLMSVLAISVSSQPSFIESQTATEFICGTPRSDFILTVETDKDEYAHNETVIITISVRNTGNEDYTITFPTSQQADYCIINEEGEQVYQWSYHMDFLQVFTDLAVRRGETKVLISDTWNQLDDEGNHVGKGTYRINDWIVPYYYNDIINSQIDGSSKYIEINGESSITILKPMEKTIYLNGREIIPFLWTIVIGKITIEITCENAVNRVEFYLNNELQHTDYEEPYEWLWNPSSTGIFTLKAIGYGIGFQSSNQLKILSINL